MKREKLRLALNVSSSQILTCCVCNRLDLNILIWNHDRILLDIGCRCSDSRQSPLDAAYMDDNTIEFVSFNNVKAPKHLQINFVGNSVQQTVLLAKGRKQI